MYTYLCFETDPLDHNWTPDQLSNYKEGKIIQNINFSYFNNRASFMGNPVGSLRSNDIMVSTYLANRLTGEPQLVYSDVIIRGGINLKQIMVIDF